MRIRLGINPTCSEAVFRFYTKDVAVMSRILERFASFSEGARINTELKVPEDVRKVNWPACNGKGECFWEPNLEALVVRVGNNDVGDHRDELMGLIEELGIPVEEATTSEELADTYGRDCSCGIVFFNGYEKLMKQPPPPREPREKNE